MSAERNLLFEEFRDAALDIIAAEPFRSKVIVKYTHKHKTIVIRVTDGKKIAAAKLRNEEQFKQLEGFIKLASKILNNYDSTQEDEQREKMEIEEQQQKQQQQQQQPQQQQQQQQQQNQQAAESFQNNSGSKQNKKKKDKRKNR